MGQSSQTTVQTLLLIVAFILVSVLVTKYHSTSTWKFFCGAPFAQVNEAGEHVVSPECIK